MAKNRRKLICVIGLTFAFSLIGSCGGASDDSDGIIVQPGNSGTASNQPPAQTVAEALDRYDAAQGVARLDYGTSLLGTDANGNGIRDDVDGYIQTLSLTDAERRGMTQWARALQSLLSLNSADPAAVARGSLSTGRAGDCLGRTMTNVNVAELMKSVSDATYNTPERLTAYMRYDSAVSGTSVEIPPTGNCDQ